jgi:ABC-2 type transport system permease protein
MDKQNSFQSFKALAKVSLRMYYRDRRAIFFTIMMPFIFLAIFAFISKGGSSSMKVDLVKNSNTELANSFSDTLRQIPGIKIVEVSEDQSRQDLSKGKIDLEIIIPSEFGQLDSQTGKFQKSAIITHYNEAKPQNGQVANLVISQAISGINNRISGVEPLVTVESSGVQTNNLNSFDFFLPGILAMTIMQFGLFGVGMAFIAHKASGSFKRIQATPIHPRNFLFAEALTRLTISMLSMLILVLVSMKLFNFHMVGNIFEFLIFIIIGTIVFLGFGLAIAGYAKDFNQAAPLLNLVQLPMLLLSGIFFPRDVLPNWLQNVTDYFPLTYLADGMRKIANEGMHLASLGGEVLGLAVWGVVIYAVAIKVFKWE